MNANSLPFLDAPNAVLWLEDGSEFPGWSFGHPEIGFGEVVFNTAMAGYQEVLTDPSYWQQLVVMTYPHQGNYGIISADEESVGGPKVSGFVVSKLSIRPSNYESEQTLEAYLKAHRIPGLFGVDTRRLTLHIRSKGAMRGLILRKEQKAAFGDHVTRAFADRPLFGGRDLVREVTTTKPYWFSDSGIKTIVAVDFGIKLNLLRELKSRGCRVVVVPAHTTADEIMAYRPNGVFLSNGPGDPSTVTYAIATVAQLLGKVPMFGVCMGHQILATALGGKTYKMPFGHRGVNQPVLDVETGRVEISSHNHGYAVDPASLPSSVHVTHKNLNDGVCEGLSCPSLRAFSVQYHPESAPGPHDSTHLFDRFLQNDFLN